MFKNCYLLIFLGALVLCSQVHAENFKVNSFYGVYNSTNKKPGIPSPSLNGPVIETWKSPETAPENINLAVLFPHLKDPFWVAVNFGIIHEAKKLGIGIQVQHAGGYRNLGKQALQLEQILKENKVDGLIIGAVQFKKKKLEDIYLQFQEKGIPIVSVVNDSFTPTINAKALVSWRDLGYQAGKFLAEHSGDRNIKIAVFPGPRGTGWAPDSHEGFLEALDKLNARDRIEMITPVWGDTGDKAQRHLVNFILKNETGIDYLIGNALAASAAVTEGPEGESPAIEKYKDRHPKIKVIATYIIPQVYQLIKQGKILASPTDLMKYQGIMAVDMMVRILNGELPGYKGFPFRSGPLVPIISRENIDSWSYETLFGKKNFKPIFKLKAKETAANLK